MPNSFSIIIIKLCFDSYLNKTQVQYRWQSSPTPSKTQPKILTLVTILTTAYSYLRSFRKTQDNAHLKEFFFTEHCIWFSLLLKKIIYLSNVQQSHHLGTEAELYLWREEVKNSRGGELSGWYRITKQDILKFLGKNTQNQTKDASSSFFCLVQLSNNHDHPYIPQASHVCTSLFVITNAMAATVTKPNN